jgi:hypothetical protein
MTADRMRVEITRKPRPPWALLWLLLGGYPDDTGDERVTVTIEDRVLGARWTIPAPSVERAEYVRDLVIAAASTLSDAEMDAWTRADTWTTLHEPRATESG